MNILTRLLSLLMLAAAILLALDVNWLAPKGTPQWDKLELAMLLLIASMLLQIFDRSQPEHDE